MAAENLPLSSKLELCKALKVVEAASRKWRKTLTVEAEGIGRQDASCCRQAEQDFHDACEEAEAITDGHVVGERLLPYTADEVPAAGLLRG